MDSEFDTIIHLDFCVIEMYCEWRISWKIKCYLRNFQFRALNLHCGVFGAWGQHSYGWKKRHKDSIPSRQYLAFWSRKTTKTWISDSLSAKNDRSKNDLSVRRKKNLSIPIFRLENNECAPVMRLNANFFLLLGWRCPVFS